MENTTANESSDSKLHPLYCMEGILDLVISVLASGEGMIQGLRFITEIGPDLSGFSFPGTECWIKLASLQSGTAIILRQVKATRFCTTDCHSVSKYNFQGDVWGKN